MSNSRCFKCLFAVFWFLCPAKKSRKVVPPVPPISRGLPLLGTYPFFGTKFEELAGVHGPIFKVWLGQKIIFLGLKDNSLKEATECLVVKL
ncbi:hypothetical protein ACB092_02G004800 [Castanea dentata]